MGDAAWRTVEATFNLLNPGNHDLLFEAYVDWAPNLIFVEVLTKVAMGDINTPAVAGAIMSAATNLAQRFNATVLIAHHLGKDKSKGPMGSNLFTCLADFMWEVSANNGTVWVKVTKMKDGEADRSHSYVADMSHGPPVVRNRSIGEQIAERTENALAVAIADKLRKTNAVDWHGGLTDRGVSRKVDRTGKRMAWAG